MTVIVSAVLVLVPLIVMPNLLFYFDVTPKIVVLLLAAALALPWSGRSIRGLVGHREGRWLCVGIAAMLLSLLVSTIFSTRPAISLGGSSWRRFGLITQAGLLLFTLVMAGHISVRPDRLRLFLRLIAATGIPVALYGLLQYFGWDPWLPKPAYHIGEGFWTIVRPPSTLGNASYFATWLLHTVFIGIALTLIERERPWRLLGAMAAILGASGIVFSGTRAAILGLLCGGVFLLVWFRPRISVRAMAVTGALAGLAIVFYYSPPGHNLRTRTRWYVEDPRGGARLWLWRDSSRMAIQHWIAGMGPETFSSEFPKYQSVALARAYPQFYHESPHNIFLDVFTAQGLPGLAGLLGLTWLGFYAAWKSAGPIIPGALAASLVASLGSQQFSCFTLPTALYFFVTIALLVGAKEPLADARGSVTQTRFLLPLAIAVSAVLAIFAVRLLIADRYLVAITRSLSTARTKEAMQQYRRYQRWRPAGASADLWYSRLMAATAGNTADLFSALQVWQQALESGLSALTLSDDVHNAYYSLANLYALQNDLLHTEASLRSAIAVAPNWFKPHWMLAQVLQAEGRQREAQTEASAAVELNGGKNEEVTRTWEQMQSLATQSK